MGQVAWYVTVHLVVGEEGSEGEEATTPVATWMGGWCTRQKSRKGQVCLCLVFAQIRQAGANDVTQAARGGRGAMCLSSIVLLHLQLAVLSFSPPLPGWPRYHASSVRCSPPGPPGRPALALA